MKIISVQLIAHKSAKLGLLCLIHKRSEVIIAPAARGAMAEQICFAAYARLHCAKPVVRWGQFCKVFRLDNGELHGIW